jgi:glycosyltransferase involved in cell wall biosynthesis
MLLRKLLNRMETLLNQGAAANPSSGRRAVAARTSEAAPDVVPTAWRLEGGYRQQALMIEIQHPTTAPLLERGDKFYASNDLVSLAPQAVVCVPTFRRPDMLRRTLQSLAEQRGAIAFALVVVDNDCANGEGLPVAASFLRDGRLSGLCLVEERQGNCHAINRAFREARERFPAADYFLMIDDDEIADPHWLERMVAAARDRNADIVGGPVVPEFPIGAPQGLTRHPIYWPAFEASGFVPMIFGSGNCLITRRAFEQVDDPDFNLRYNFLGGGDTDFFTRCRAAGLVFYWEQNARIVETVPVERLQSGWVLRRSLRIGAINFRIDQTRSRTLRARARLVAKNLALVPVSAFRSLKLAPRRGSLLATLHPLIIAIGRIIASFGGEPEQYRFKESGPK